jgi:hypothetical protein
MPIGLGDEKLWLCPTLDNVTPFDDLSDQGNNGTAVGGLTTAADTGSGGAYSYDFDGTNDYITYPIAAIDSANSIGSVSAWVKTGSAANPGGQIIGGSDTASTNAWSHLRLDSGEPTVVTYSSGQVGEKQSSTNVNDSNWHHVCAVGDGSNHSIYIDGTLASSTWVGTNYGNRWIGYPAGMDTGLVGALVRSWGTGNLFDGQMDDIRAYNRVLTQSEITHLATARGIEGRPFDGLGGEQLWLCPSLENSPNDLSGNNNNGVYNGGMGTVADTAEGGSLAYDFDGTDDYIDCGNILGGTIGGNDTAVTYTSWMKIDNYTNSNNLYGTTWMGKSDDVSNGGYLLNSINGQITFDRFPAGSNGYFYLLTGSPASQVPLTTWKHVAVTYSGCETTGCTSIYVDGVAVSVTETDSSYGTGMGENTNTFKIGETFSGSPYKRMMDGQLDDIRVYNRVLTQAEISWLATGRGVLGAPPEGLGDEQLWVSPTLTLDDVYDISDNGNTALIDGTVPVVEDTTGFESFQTDNTTLGADYVYFNAPSASDLPSASLAFWASSNFTTSYAPVGGFCTTGFNDLRFFFGRKALENVVRLYAKQASGAVTNTDISMPAGKSLTDSVMRHWAITCSGGIVFLYLDGVLIGQTATAFTSDLDIGGINLSLGSQDGRTTSGSAAKYDDIRFYDRALTQAEISWLATERGVLGTPPVGLGDEQLWLCPSIQDSANDLSGNGNNGSYQNGTATVADTDATYGGTRAYFSNAQSQSVLVSNFGDSLNDTTSISMWVKSVNPWVCVPVANGGLGYSTSTWQYALFNSGTSRLLWRRSANLTLSGATPSDQWQHIVIIRDNGSSTQEVYVDGVLDVTSASFTGTYGTNQTWFGFGNTIGTNEELYMDDMRTYGRVLTQSEITHLASQRGVLGSPATTTQYNAFLTHAFRQLFQTRLR